jgi:hypothetical protein
VSTASKAMIKPFLRTYGEGGRFFIVKGAARFVFFASLFDFNTLSNDLCNI